jgi:hypothetical protein
MRLIDADKAVEQINEWLDQTEAIPLNTSYHFELLGCIEDCPTIDAVPVVRGEWKMDTDPDDGDCRCSNCLVCIDALHRRNHGVLNALGYKLHTFYKYCPNCGTKMEEG